MTKERVLRFEGVKMGYAAPEGGRVEVLDVPAFELPGGGGMSRCAARASRARLRCFTSSRASSSPTRASCPSRAPTWSS